MHVIHADSVLASVVSAGASLSIAATNPPPLSGEPLTWLPYIMSAIGPAAVLIVNRILSAKAAARRAKAAFLEEEAKKEESDADTSNDAAARAKRIESLELRAEADALEALKPPVAGK